MDWLVVGSWHKGQRKLCDSWACACNYHQGGPDNIQFEDLKRRVLAEWKRNYRNMGTNLNWVFSIQYLDRTKRGGKWGIVW